MYKIISFTISLVFLALGLLLGIFNPHSVDVDFISFQTQLPLSLVIASSILLGLLIALIYLGSSFFAMKWKIRKMNKESLKLNNQILNLNRQLLEQKTEILSTKADSDLMITDKRT